MKLSELLAFDEIVIQCHDNPDVDAIASGWALYKFFQEKGKNVRLVYGGRFIIQKSNLVLMKDLYNIPIEHVDVICNPQLLIMVDCQYGEGNAARFIAQNIAVIDHHQVSTQLPALSEVRSNIGACATIVWKLLKDEGFNVNMYSELSTALYYALMTDTNNFTEIFHPLDRDMQEFLMIKQAHIRRFRNSNLSMAELKIAAQALESSEYNEKHHFGIVEALPCDPNVLGIISDMLLEVHLIDTSVVYSVLDFGVKFSIRSCIKEVKASELAEYISEDIGSGGGHIEKAGGILNRNLLMEAGIPNTKEGIRDFIYGKMIEYFETTKIIYGNEIDIKVDQMKPFQKKMLLHGYVDPEEMGLSDKTVNIRTFEGDAEVFLTKDIYMMIGVSGNVFPIRKVNFDKTYYYVDDEYDFLGDYAPSVKDNLTGSTYALTNFARACVSTQVQNVYARRIDSRVKLFENFDSDRYILGKPGDYLVCNEDLSDIYIMEKENFIKTFSPCMGNINR